MSAEHPEMTAQDVLELLALFQQHGIEVIVDGGWGVDALVGRQTRRHDDLDIAVAHPAGQRIRALLEANGYREVPRDDSWECNFVLGDEQGHLLDVHTYLFDKDGQLVFGVPYPPDSLNGTGSIAGTPVKCIPPAWMVQFHSGYPLDENDYRDVKVLCQHFDLPVPEDYADFARREATGLPDRGSRITLDAFFKDYADSRQLYLALCPLLHSLGGVEQKVTKSQIAFWRRRAFAWVWIPEQYLRRKAAPLVLSLSFPKQDPSSRWKQVVEPARGRFMHHLELNSLTDIDPEVQAWLQAAWEVAE